MKYTVIWRVVADDALAQIWIDSDDRAEVTTAAHMIDQALVRDPAEKGESREDDVRILFERPLGVMFSVDDNEHKVFVESVWHIKRKHP